MAITVTCPSCSTSFPVDPAKIPEGGVNARCSSCGDIFRIEKPVEAEPLPTVADLTPVEASPPAESPPTPEPEVAKTPPPAEPPPLPEEPVAEAMDHAPEVTGDPFAQPAPFEKAAPLGNAAPFEEVAPFEEAASADAAVPSEQALPEPEPSKALPPVETAESLPAPESADEGPSVHEPAAESEAAEAVAETSAPAVQGFTFGKRDPTDKAKRLARVLVSDMIMYNAERHQTALAQGTLQQDFEEEIEKSWKEFVDQVGEELANNEGRAFWKDALNDILAKGDQVF